MELFLESIPTGLLSASDYPDFGDEQQTPCEHHKTQTLARC
jgi:hypothetical protein